MSEFIVTAAAQNIIGLSRRTVRAAALSMLMLSGLTAQAFSAQEQISQVQTLEGSVRVTNTGKVQETEGSGAKVCMLTIRRGGEESVC